MAFEIWCKQEKGELSTSTVFERSRFIRLRSLEQILLRIFTQLFRYSLWSNSLFYGSIQSIMASAQLFQLAVNRMISKLRLAFLRKLIVQGLKAIQAFSKVLPVGISTSKSQGLILADWQWIKVSSKSIISIFLFAFSEDRGKFIVFVDFGFCQTVVISLNLQRISRDKFKCQRALSFVPVIPLTISEIQQVLRLLAQSCCSFSSLKWVSFFLLQKLSVLYSILSIISLQNDFSSFSKDQLTSFSVMLKLVIMFCFLMLSCFLAKSSFCDNPCRVQSNQAVFLDYFCLTQLNYTVLLTLFKP